MSLLRHSAWCCRREIRVGGSRREIQLIAPTALTRAWIRKGAEIGALGAAR
jgi:hypothetical protein